MLAPVVSVTAEDIWKVSAAPGADVDVSGFNPIKSEILAPPGRMTAPAVLVSTYWIEYGPEPNTWAVQTAEQSGTPPQDWIEPVGAADTAAAGTEIVIVVIPGLPAGLLMVITLETAPLVAILAKIG